MVCLVTGAVAVQKNIGSGILSVRVYNPSQTGIHDTFNTSILLPSMGNNQSSPRQRPLDTSADYNAFGRDPDGRLAFLAAFFWGRDYIPTFTIQQFAGPPEPPRFGPPARYQMACLPPGWKPRAPPKFYGLDLANHSEDNLDPPTGIFDPKIFAALQHIARFESSQSCEPPKTIDICY